MCIRDRLGTDPIGGWSAGIALVPLLLQTFVRSGLGSWGSVAAAVGILAAAIVQRNWFLAAWISVLGVVALLLEDFFWANRLSELRNWLSGFQDPRVGYADFTQYIAIAGVLAFILGIAAWALRREWVR